MAKPNFKYEKRQRELAKQKKKEEKRQRKQDKNATTPEAVPKDQTEAPTPEPTDR